MMIHRKFMSAAITEAEKALQNDDVPIGCVITRDNEIIGKGFNRVEIDQNPTAHAELFAINEAVKNIGHKHLLGCSIYVTLEPCSMCAGAIVLARAGNLFIGAQDTKTGACGSIFNIPEDTNLNHKVNVYQGIMEDECSQMLKDFFKELRAKKNA